MQVLKASAFNRCALRPPRPPAKRPCSHSGRSSSSSSPRSCSLSALLCFGFCSLFLFVFQWFNCFYSSEFVFFWSISSPRCSTSCSRVAHLLLPVWRLVGVRVDMFSCHVRVDLLLLAFLASCASSSSRAPTARFRWCLFFLSFCTS